MQLSMVLVTLVLIDSLDSQCPNRKTDLANVRKRRYLNFPDQTNMVLTMSLLKAFMTHAPSGWNLALEVDVLFPMPDANFTNAHYRRKLHHRQRREFWEQIQNAIDLHSVNGKACILRSVCEAKKYLAPPGKSLVHDLLRALFIAPLHDDEFHDEIRGTYDEVLDPGLCSNTFECPLSILHTILAFNRVKY
ncbi:uncharacterized protein LOC121734174 [Aricia agestis]|uniref:uncharacterized protein LOC121734174 n=1 Tax=Aricia agestis TaxID=91739 RepID=UPI001C206F76|nr:uncharacterized protein LOC121734174 [Aricia agestis]